MSDSLETPRTIAHQAPLSMRFPRQEYWNGLPFHSRGNLPDSGKIEPGYPAFLKEMGIPDHLTYLLRNPYSGQETTVRTGHGTMGWFTIGKGVGQGCVLPPCLFNWYAEYIMSRLKTEDEKKRHTMQTIAII